MTKPLGVIVLALGLLGTVAYLSAAADGPAGSAKDRCDVAGDPLPSRAQARLGTLRWRNGSNPIYVAYSFDNRKLFTAGSDGVFHVWEAATGKLLTSFGKDVSRTGSALPAISALNPGAVALSRDQKRAAVCQGTLVQPKTITIYDVATGKEIHSWTVNVNRLAGPCLCFASDNKSLFIKGNAPQVVQLDLENGKIVRTLDEDTVGALVAGNPASSLIVTPDGKTLIRSGSGARNFPIRCFEIATGKELEADKAFDDSAEVLDLTADGKLLAWARRDGTIRLWDPAASKEVRRLGEASSETFDALTFSPDGKLIVGRSTDQTARIWDVGTGKEMCRLSGLEAARADKKAFLFHQPGDLGTGKMAFSPDGKHIAMATIGGSVRQWETATGKELPQSHGSHHGAPEVVAIAPDNTAVTYAGDRTIRAWDLRTGRLIRSSSVPGNHYQAVLSADAQTLALIADDGTVRAIDVSSGKEIGKWQAAQKLKGGGMGTLGRASSIALAPDGKIVAVCDGDQRIHIHDTATGKELRNMGQPGDVQGVLGSQSGPMCFAPDGSTLALLTGGPGSVLAKRSGPLMSTAGHPRLLIFDATTEKLLHMLDLGKRRARSVAFAPDGRTIAVASDDDTVSILEIASGKERSRIQTEVQPLSTVAFTPDGRTLAAAGQDGLMLAYSVRSGKEVAEFRGHLRAVAALVVSPDGKTLLSGSDDTTALAWSLAGIGKEEKPVVAELDGAKLEALWKDLNSDDAPKALEAIVALSAAPKQAVPILQERLKPVPTADAAQVRQLVTDLGSQRFAVRQRATEELKNLGEGATTVLRQILTEKPDPETQRRIEGLLQQFTTFTASAGDTLRLLRAVEVLERAGTREARAVVEGLAKGAPGAALTRSAQQTLARMTKK
jgi:WD40 repeat protein